MKKIKNTYSSPKLSGEQIIEKKLLEANAMLKKVDLTNLPKRTESKQD